MFTSRKILYFIILSLLIVCAVNGIDYRSNSYSAVEESSTTLVDFSDSGFFAVNMPDGDSVSIVGRLDEDGDGTDIGDGGQVHIDIDNTPDESDTTATEEGSQTDATGSDTTTASTTAATMSTSATSSATTAPSSATLTTAASNAQPTLTTNPNSQQTSPTQNTQPALTTEYVAPTNPPELTTAATTTTTTTMPTTTTTTEAYYDSGSIHFAYSEVTIYAGANTTVEVTFPIGSQKLASFSSKDSSIATVRNYDDTTALINGLNVGTTWIQATNATGDVAYCKINVTDFAHEVIRLTNIERNNQGLPSLSEGIPLVQNVADIRLSESESYFSHTRPNGKKFSSAAQDVGLSYNYIGENLACGQTTPQQVIQEWMASPTHRANILSPNYTTLCVSYGIGPDGMPYWVQIFHTP